MRDVVITGLGVVSPIGVGRAEFAAALAEGKSGVGPISQFDASALPVRIGAEIRDYDAKRYVKPRKSLKVMCREIQIAFGAAEMAWEEAVPEGADPERLGVILGADFIYGELPELEAAYRACLVGGEFDFSRWGGDALSELTPLWMLKYLPNMAACHIGIARDARGPNNTIVLGEASSLLAISEGARIIERGAADVMIVGGVSSRLHPAAIAYRTSDQLSHRNDDPQRASRPFDAQRDGMVNGEGAGALVLESLEHARRRGAKILGRVLGAASRFEPGLPNGPLAPGQAIRAALAAALRDAALKPEEVGYVSAHGVSTLERDRAEAGAIREVLGDAPVTALKSYFGNAGAASGAVEAVAGLLALERGEIPVTLNYEHPDPECPVCVVAGQPRPIDRPTVALLGHNTMGQAATVIFGGPVTP